MKSLIAILIYTITFMVFFFIISLIGLLWVPNYYTIISEGGWFVLYTVAFGWWIAYMPTREYMARHQDYFDEVFN